MPLTAEKYASIATSYDKAAEDELVSADRRAEFAKKAAWFHHLAELEAKRESSAQMSEPSTHDGRDNFTAEGKFFGMKHLLTTLWLTGAVLYLVGTLIFTRAVNLVGEDQEIGSNTAPLTNPKKPEVAAAPSVPEPRTAVRLSEATRHPHAISPDEPSSMGPPKVAEIGSNSVQTAPPPIPNPATRHVVQGPRSELDLSTQPKPPALEQQSSEQLPTLAETTRPPSSSPSMAQQTTLRLVSAAGIRSGPSFSAQIIGTAAAGAELQVTARESDWVQFIDPNSGKHGWIHASRMEPTGVDEARVAVTNPASDTPQVEAAKPNATKNAKKRSKDRSISKLPPDRTPKAYVELPSDEEFLPPKRRGIGILERRRMLRQGLMSPGFLPPR
jgi:hypothetical protein